MRLTLFMTRGMSLQDWQEGGMFAREVAIYERMRDQGFEIGIITYGDSSEQIFADRLKGIRILCNQWKFPAWLYAMFIPLLHRDWMRGTDFIKSNQINGSEVALRAAKFYGKPFVARCGYMWSINTASVHGERSLRTLYARYIERRIFLAADRIVVTTDALVSNVKSRFPGVSKNVIRIPNYVQTDHFAPSVTVVSDVDLIYVGRLAPEKNLESLLLAIQSTNLSLAIVGSGILRSKLEKLYGDMDGRIFWFGTVQNSKLPALFQRAKLFVQPSYYEGHPKALLEALACGLAVLGTRVPGICDVIEHDVNGWLCEPSAGSIRSAIIKLIGDEELRQRLSIQGRAYILRNCGLDQVLENECKLYGEMNAKSA